MRENKYRVWDTWNKKYFEPVYEAHAGRLSELLLSPSGVVLERTLEGVSMIDHQAGRWVVQFFTGVNDFLGKEMFEGDLVETESGNIREVVYEDGCYWIKDKARGYTFPINFIKMSKKVSVTIVGNIHETPHLVKPV